LILSRLVTTEMSKDDQPHARTPTPTPFDGGLAFGGDRHGPTGQNADR
jgi:hypothetical protein